MFRIHKPALPLSRYVESLWYASTSGMAPSRQRVYPDGAMALVIHLEKPTATYFVGEETRSIGVPLLAGPWSQSFQIDPSLSTGVVGVVFRPGAARMFFPVAAHELHNIDIPLQELYPSEADRLLNEVCSAAGEEARLRVVEEYLRQRLMRAAPIPPAVNYAVRQLSSAGGVRRVRAIQRETGLSHTRFIQLFREHVGLTPKLFCRVRRFRALLNRMEKGEPVSWAELAADCGYFDQAHMIRDFRAFAGATPGEFSRLPEAASRSSASPASS
ncbi:MAG TPA: helix-turn-helix domain-containing protein [Acidobacteriaceae bacterium]|nr:helix-turn-helix domain-containing protein [Acidobacteriaceae bacterium]